MNPVVDLNNCVDGKNLNEQWALKVSIIDDDSSDK
jgi:hypothetical protein